MNVMVRSMFISVSVRKLEKFGVWMVVRRGGTLSDGFPFRNALIAVGGAKIQGHD